MLLLATSGCPGCGHGDGVHHLPDAPDLSDTIDADMVHAGGAMLVTQSPAGSVPVAQWEGALAFRIDTDGGTELAITGIDKAALRDPVFPMYRASSSEVWIANRHGNSAADGVAGSISRFHYDPRTQAFVARGEITGASLIAPHQIALHPQTGELFAGNKDSGVARFTFDGDNPVANGTIADGPVRGVQIAPDGGMLYVSSATSTVRLFALPSGIEQPSVTLPVSAGLHFMAIRAGQLYIAGIDAAKVFRFQINADDTLTVLAAIDCPPNPAAVAFSEDGLEMFVPGHRSTTAIGRFRYVAATDAWEPTTEILVSDSLGGIAMLPIR